MSKLPVMRRKNGLGLLVTGRQRNRYMKRQKHASTTYTQTTLEILTLRRKPEPPFFSRTDGHETDPPDITVELQAFAGATQGEKPDRDTAAAVVTLDLYVHRPSARTRLLQAIPFSRSIAPFLVTPAMPIGNPIPFPLV